MNSKFPSETQLLLLRNGNMELYNRAVYSRTLKEHTVFTALRGGRANWVVILHSWNLSSSYSLHHDLLKSKMPSRIGLKRKWQLSWLPSLSHSGRCNGSNNFRVADYLLLLSLVPGASWACSNHWLSPLLLLLLLLLLLSLLLKTYTE